MPTEVVKHYIFEYGPVWIRGNRERTVGMLLAYSNRSNAVNRQINS
jgi:hypothetical protein